MVTATEEKQLQVNGSNVSYEDTGIGTTPLIFIHGFPFNKSTWQPQIESLKKNNRVIAYDLRGFGGSEPGSAAISIDQFATDLIQFMDALKIEKAIVCGLSMGGYILMNAVSTPPKRFEAMILSDTQCIADSDENREKRYKTIEQIEKDGLEKFAETFVQNVFCKKTLQDRKEIVDQVKRLILKTSPKTITATLKALAERKETCNSLKSLEIPALIICGKEDSVTPLSQSELMNNAISSSTLHIIEDAGHLSNLEQPETFNEHIHNFLPGIIS